MRLSRTTFTAQANGTQSHIAWYVTRLSLNIAIKMKKLLKLFMVALIASAGVTVAQDAKIDALEKQLKAIQEQMAQLQATGGMGQAAAKGLTFNFYGELKWINKNHGNDKFDPHRFVLMPKYEISDNARFVSEIEIEHGGNEQHEWDNTNSRNTGTRLDGYTALEQFYLEWDINDYFKPRAGINLIPVGTINQDHEPNLFYSVHRPIMYKYIIPTTWMEMGFGTYGDIAEGLDYALFLSSGLTKDQNPHKMTDGNLGPRNHRPSLREDDGNDSLAVSAKLRYRAGGFDGSISTYQTSMEGTGGDSDMALYDIEGSYRFNEGALAGVEVIADYAWWDISDPAKLVGGTLGTQTGDKMDGYRLELAYHMDHGNNTIVPFFRAEGYSLESGPSGSHQNYLTYGAMYAFGKGADQKWEIKVAMRQSLDDDQSSDFSIGVGMQF